MFDFLDDGTQKNSLESIRKKLNTDPDALLAECREAVEKASSAPLADAIARIEKPVREKLTQIAKHARTSVDAFPMPRGVFVEEQDRKRAYIHVLDALPTLHRLVRALEQSAASYLQVSRLAATRERHALIAERLLCLTELALSETGASTLPYTSLHEVLKQETAKASELLSLSGRNADLLIGFCNRTAVSFFLRAEQVADLQNGGGAADPKTAALLFDRLGREADLVTDEMLLSQSHLSRKEIF